MHDTQQLLKIANYYQSIQKLIKIAVIKKMPNGKYRVESHKGKNLGTYDSHEKAVKRLQQVEYFKHNKADDALADDKESEKVIDLTNATDFSFSAIMREMRQEASKEQVHLFLTMFKKEFDASVKNKLQKPEKIALQNSLVKFNKKNKIKCKKKLVKNAAISELGDPTAIGKYLANIVKLTLNRMPSEQKTKALANLKHKFYSFNANEIAQKSMPPTSGIGQAITFVKHILLGHDAVYIREVLNALVGNL